MSNDGDEDEDDEDDEEDIVMVIDNGTNCLKIGFSGDSHCTAVIANVIGTPGPKSNLEKGQGFKDSNSNTPSYIGKVVITS